MKLDFDTIQIPEEQLTKTIENNMKKVHHLHHKQIFHRTAGIF